MSEGGRQRLPYARISAAGIAPMRALEHYLNAESGLEAVLLELVRLRVSLMNGCAFCIGLHTHELRRHNEPQSRIDGVAGWRESDAYTERERAALAWAETLTRISGEVGEEPFRAVSAHFGDKELVDLSLAIASINAWNRLGVAFLPQWDERRVRGERKGNDADAAESDRGGGGVPRDDAAAGAAEAGVRAGEDDGGKVAVENEDAL